MREDFALESTINKFYLKILERRPDSQELKNFINQIKSGQLDLTDLEKSFKNSKEYQSLQLLKHKGFVQTLFGTKMYLDKNDLVVSKELANNKVWEPQETKYLKKIIKKGMNAVDIGAHIGYYSVLFSKWVGNKGKVFCFEPEPDNFKLLLKNKRANHSKNLVLFQKAVSNIDGSTNLFLNAENKGDHRILDFYVSGNDESRQKIKIDCIKLDSVISARQKIDVIKMDIQGAEMLALQGMNEILTNNPTMTMLIEFWPFAIEKSGYRPEQFLEKIRQYEFTISILKDKKLIPVEKEDEFFKNYTSTDYFNLVCKKGHKKTVRRKTKPSKIKPRKTPKHKLQKEKLPRENWKKKSFQKKS